MAEYNPSKIIKDGNTYNFRDTTKIPLSGSDQISGDLIPSTDGTVNLGSLSKQFNIIHSTSVVNHSTSIELALSNANDGADMTLCPKEYYGGFFRIRAYDGTTRQVLQGNANGTLIWSGNVIRPNSNNTCDLGTSTSKWKSLNGINPGALSLPSTSMGINLDLTDFKLDGSDNKFRLTNFSNYPYDNGWLFVRLNGCTYYYLDHWFKVVSNGYANPSTAIFFLPINDNDHEITLRCVCAKIDYIRVFPCQGNV